MKDFQIDYFLAVAKDCSFVKAAERLYISQPSISRQISSLEKELGVSLFNRQRNSGTKLTAAGELFYAFFKDYKNSLLTTKYHAKIITEKAEGIFRVGYPEGWSLPDFFPELLKKLTRKYPSIHISPYVWNLRELMEELEAGNLDIIIFPEMIASVPPSFVLQKITEIPHILLYSTRSPQAKLKNPTLEDFRDDAIYVVDAFDNTIEYVRRLFQFYRIDSEKIISVPNIETATSRVQNGLGVVVLNAWSREQYDQRFRSLFLKTFQKISFAYLKDDANLFLDIFIKQFMNYFSEQKTHSKGSESQSYNHLAI
jgi:DNA-binding transcriptional LysR family regulator